ncbi:iron-containing alcohol dehydrogenase [Thalassotalea piscium]|uniref:Alcohol dehydrogenase class IV n=1 Tax=Thalassotalea piscium TaxID=1230533 RepID=A0A7X0NH60_9GAMM|nr:iron-containing alcohol dehydrogenase [Thalassotalea piscium]MBB6543278.1 alcohol dehydrogenase class IV [Thalassotalea piscium]
MLHTLIIKIRAQVNKLLDIPFPTLISGEGSIKQSPTQLIQLKAHKPFIVTDAVLVKLGIVKMLTDALTEARIDYYIFDQVTPDPTTEIVNNGLTHYRDNHCDSFIALGGGSVMDCAKGIAASITKNKDIKQLKGLFRIRASLPPFIAIPTTAGTGSEATLVAVITESIKKQKFTIIDPVLVPDIAIVDPLLMVGLPPKITAETGIDALTHAIESYSGLHSTELTKAYSCDAVYRIFNYLPLAYTNGKDLDARREMSIASFNAGVAFTRTSIGYVHAIAHQLGGYYHIPHGLANAVLLPHIMEFSFNHSIYSYADLAISAGLATTTDTKLSAAKKLVNGVKMLNEQLNIQTGFKELKAEDITILAKRAIKEAYCEYPVPRQMTVSQCEEILSKLLV